MSEWSLEADVELVTDNYRIHFTKTVQCKFMLLIWNVTDNKVTLHVLWWTSLVLQRTAELHWCCDHLISVTHLPVDEQPAGFVQGSEAHRRLLRVGVKEASGGHWRPIIPQNAAILETVQTAIHTGDTDTAYQYKSHTSTLQVTYSSAVATKTEQFPLLDLRAGVTPSSWGLGDWICHCDLACWLCAFYHHHHPLGVLKQHVRTKGWTWGPVFAPWHVYLSAVSQSHSADFQIVWLLS